MLSTPRIVVGHLFNDKWCTPYVRGEFDLQPGRYAMEITIRNHKAAAFLENRVDVRRGLSLIGSTGALDLQSSRLVSTTVEIDADNLTLSVSLRSTVSWQPPAPDARSLGFILLNWECRSID
jgi:hypothetical protein